VIFEPRYLEKIKGRVTVLDSQRELMAAALLYKGYPANDTDEEHWKQARDMIIRAKPYWAAFNASSYIKELAVGNYLAGARLLQRHLPGQSRCAESWTKIYYRSKYSKRGGSSFAGLDGAAQVRAAA